jgi:hypothetical protein
MSYAIRDYFVTRPPAAKLERILAAAGIVVVSAGAFMIQHFNPVTAGFFPKCPFFLLTGCYCPGCGSTRGFHALFNGNIPLALHDNLMMIFMLPVLAWLFVSYLLVALRGRPLPRVFVPVPLIWTIGGLIVAFWIVRNIPVYPFTLLAPLTI